MAYTDYLLRFRRLTTEELMRKQCELEKEETIYSQQGMGTKSMTRDLRLLQDQLNAVAYILTERESSRKNGVGITDFSCIR